MTTTASFASAHHIPNEGEFSQHSGDNYTRNSSGQPSLRRLARWSTERMEALSEFSRQMIATNSLDSLLESIPRRAANLVQASFCRILALEADGAFVCLAAYHSVPLAYRWLKGELEPQVLSSIYQRILLSENPVVIHRADTSLTESERWALELQFAVCLCIVPLRVETTSIGLLILGDERPGETGSFSDDRLTMATVIANQAASAIDRAHLSQQLEENRLETVLALAKAIEARDLYTGNHSKQTAELAERIAKKLHCTNIEMQAIRWAALLHDIGKIGVPDEILLSPGPLTLNEWAIVKQHPQIGAEIVLKVSNLSLVASYILAHHERFDGSGYPKGLKGEAIPLGGRILAVIDAYTAITMGRAYQTSRSHVEALEEIKRCSGKNFDPQVVDAFIS